MRQGRLRHPPRTGAAAADEKAAARLDSLTRFHVMAATLLHIKSRMLLPLPFSGDEPYEDPRQELVERLLEYQRFKRLSDVLSEQQEAAHWIITRNEAAHASGPAVRFAGGAQRQRHPALARRIAGLLPRDRGRNRR